MWGLAVLTAAALVLPSVASAPAASNKITAPYTGSTVTSSTRIVVVGCTHYSLAKSRWNLTTGIGGFSARATASSCPSTTGASNTSSVTINGVTTFRVPLSIPSTPPGPATITANMTWNGSATNRTAVLWNCPPAARLTSHTGFNLEDCNAAVNDRFNATAMLIDTTTNRPVSQGLDSYGYSQNLEIYSQDFCYWYGCGWSNYSMAFNLGVPSTTQAWVLHLNPVPNNNYALEITVQSFVIVTLAGFTNSTMLGALNYGTQGHEWSLNSIVVT